MTRKYGTGSLYQRQSDGRWIGRLPDGRGGYRYVSRVDREETRRLLDEMRRERDRKTSATPSRGGERVRDLVARYQADVDPVRNRWKTLANNKQMARDHILPTLGSIRVRQLEPADVQRMVNGMIAAGLSPRTAGNAVTTLSSMLRHAMREGTIDRNVASLVVMPKTPRPHHEALTPDQLHAFIEATRGEPLWPVWAFMASTAVRPGELLGLRWRDLGPGDTTATIAGQYRTVVEKDAAGHRTALVFQRQATKTTASAATIPLPALAREAIRVQRAKATSIDVVFARASGHGPLNHAWLVRRFHDALAAHGFPRVRLHSLRSSALLTVLEETGGDLLAAKEMARHESITTTIDRYASDAATARDKAAAAMDSARARRKA